MSVCEAHTLVKASRYVHMKHTRIPANLQSTEVGIASHKNREIEEKKKKKIGRSP